MREDLNTSDPAVPLTGAALPTAAATAGAAGEATVEVPLAGLRRRAWSAGSRWERLRESRLAGQLAVAALVLCTFTVVFTATADPSTLVPRSAEVFPNWESGPLHLISFRLITNANTLGLAFSAVLAVMILAYAVAIAAVRTMSMRLIAIAVLVLHLILLLCPPLQLTDIFNYLGYARLGALHHLNPYTHVIKQAMFDPVYRFTSWHSLRSPYGPLFTAFTYPLALVSLPLAYWAIKISTVALSLVFVALVWHCARRLGRDPRFAVAFVAFNPAFLLYELGGIHNDFFMLAPSMAAIALVLARRERLAGAALMLAVATKFTAVILLPFLLVAARDRPRQVRVIVGAVVATIPLAALSIALFGFSIPNLQQQSSLLTDFSIPNTVGLILHIGGGTPLLLKVGVVVVVVVVAHQFLRQRDWVTGAGWSTFALIGSLAWLVPWYVVWLLPLAALSTSVRLRRTAAALTVFVIASFWPATAQYMNDHGINPLNTAAGQASQSLQHKLSN